MKRDTKVDDLQNEIIRLESKMDERFRLQSKLLRLDIKMGIDESFLRFEEVLIQFRNDIYTRLDPLIKDLEKRQEEGIIASEQYARQQKRLDNHGQRIAQLETSHKTS